MVLHQQQKLYILLILHKEIKDLYYVYTIMKAIISYLLMLQKYQFKAKKSEIKDYAPCLGLGNISIPFTIINKKRRGLL